jgi:Mn-dependent DtxR family transcriptional regulator
MSAGPSVAVPAPPTNTATQPLAYPTAPSSCQASGLEAAVLVDLTAKYVLTHGRSRLIDLVAALKLSPAVVNEVLQLMRQDALIEITRQGISDAGIECRLTENGRARATESMRQSRYVGPAPVTLEQYSKIVRAQAETLPTIDRTAMIEAFGDLIIARDVADRLGAAMNSRRALLLYGPAGSGKTFLAERLALLLPGGVFIPYAVIVGADIIQIFDPLIHRPLSEVTETRPEPFVASARHDRRWLLCQRPMVLTGGELTLNMLDLRYDPNAGFYQAPPHVKAMGGLYIVDDLGRQLVAPRELMNRWIVPLERGVDYLTTNGGMKFEVPFEVKVVFSTNFSPSRLADEAFLRRFGHKIHIGSVSPRDYQRLFEQSCMQQGVKFVRSAFEWLLAELHSREKRPLLAAYPRDIVGRVAEVAQYHGRSAELSIELLEHAWQTYFISNTEPDVEANTFGTA